MQRDYRSITLFNNVTPVAVTSSTDATPIVVTATAHGFNTGDRVLIYGHTTNVAANGIFKVTRLSSSTFSLQDEILGTDVGGSGGGAGASGLCLKAPPIVYIKDYRNIILQFGTSGTSTLTVKVAGSLGKPSSSTVFDNVMPNFGATVSPSNPYSFLQIINLDTAATVNGATGIAASGADINNMYEVNINAMTYFTLVPTAWTQGAINAVLLVANNI